MYLEKLSEVLTRPLCTIPAATRMAAPPAPSPPHESERVAVAHPRPRLYIQEGANALHQRVTEGKKHTENTRTERRHQKRKRRKDKGSLLRWLRPDGVDWGANVADYDPAAVEHALRWMRILFGHRRYFRVEVAGWDHLPDPPVMLASNHSGGTLFLDTWGLLFAWYSRFGTRRPVHPAAHEMLLSSRLLGEFMARRGVVRADRRLAERVLTHWKEDLLVMPGGDLDVWRPFKARFEVRFAGRTGYAQLALKAGVPIVPVANAGAHGTLVVLSDGRRFAEALRLPQIARASIWPVHLSLPWGIGFGPLPHIPTPARLRYRFGPAIRPEDVGATPGRTPSKEHIAALDTRVRAGVQTELDALRRER